MSRAQVAEPISITSPAWEQDPNLYLYVVFTDRAATNAALKAARHLARDLNTRLVLLVAKVVPYPLPLEAPPVPDAFTAAVLTQLAASQESEVTVRVYLCRDRDQTIRQALEPASLVVMGRRKRWWAPAMPRLARLLKRDGHEVILAGAGSTDRSRIGPMKVESSL